MLNHPRQVCGQHTDISDHLTNMIVSNGKGRVVNFERERRSKQSLAWGLTAMGCSYYRFPILSILIRVLVTLFVIHASLARAKLFTS